MLILAVFFVAGIYSRSFIAEKIVIQGSGDSQRLLRILADVFQKKHPGKIIEIPESIGSSGGIKALENGKCDLARIARPMKDIDLKLGLACKVFAFTPLVFVVNNNLKEVDNFSDEQVVSIYSGKIASWSQLGGRDAKIYTINREEGESCRIVLEKNIPGLKKALFLASQIVFDNIALVEILAENKDAVAYTSLGVAKDSGLVIMKLNGVYPSLENVKSGAYKLTLPLGIVWKGQLSGLAKDFVDFLFSVEAKKIIVDNGVVPSN